MSKIIEISDSEDESNTAEEEAMEIEEPLKPAPPIAAPPPAAEPPVALPSSSTSTTSSASTGTPPKPAAETAARVRNRRKTTHQPIRASPEIQFETIALDDDEEIAASGSNNTAATAQQSKPSNSYKTTPKILASKMMNSKATAEQLLDAACLELFNDEEMRSTLKHITEERVRVNFMLASCGMPEIKFTMETPINVLKFQLHDRLKQRYMRQAEIARQRQAKKEANATGAQTATRQLK